MFTVALGYLVAAVITCATAGLPVVGATLPNAFNALTGLGSDRFSCSVDGTPEFAAESLQVQTGGVTWLRLEFAVAPLMVPPRNRNCPPPTGLAGLATAASRTTGITARPIVKIGGWHYTPTLPPGSVAWLNHTLAAATGTAAIAVGDAQGPSYLALRLAGTPPGEPPGGQKAPHAGTDPARAAIACPPRADATTAAAAKVVASVASLASRYGGLVEALRDVTGFVSRTSAWLAGYGADSAQLADWFEDVVALEPAEFALLALL